MINRNIDIVWEYTMDMDYTASGSISYNQISYPDQSEGYEENVIREGFKEVFTNEFGAKEVKLKLDIGTGEPNIRLFPKPRLPRTRAAPTPQVKAVPPPSQPTKPIINEQGRVKRAFDFND